MAPWRSSMISFLWNPIDIYHSSFYLTFLLDYTCPPGNTLVLKQSNFESYFNILSWYFKTAFHTIPTALYSNCDEANVQRWAYLYACYYIKKKICCQSRVIERKRLGEGKRERGDRCFQYALRIVGPDFERRGCWGSLVTWHSGTTLEKIKPWVLF